MGSAGLGIRRWRWLAAAALTAAIGVAAWGLGRLSVDNAIEAYLSQGSQQYARYRDFRRIFGSEEMVILAARSADSTPAALARRLGHLADKLRQLPGVRRVADVESVARAMLAGRGNYVEILRKFGAMKGLLIGPDGRTLGVMAWLRTQPDPARRRKLMGHITRLVDAERDRGGLELHMAGPPVLNAALDAGSRQSAQRLIPLALAVSVVVLLVSLRSVGATVASLMSVALAVVGTMGLIGWFGRPLNVVTLALPPLLFVLALSGAIHLAGRYLFLRRQPGRAGQTVRSVLAELTWPIVLAGVTTAVGFASLTLAEMPPVAELGLFAAAGVLLSLACHLTVLPVLLVLLVRKRAGRSARASRWTGRLTSWASRRAGRVLLVGLALLAGAGVWVTRLRPDANVMHFLPDDNPTVVGQRFVAEHLTGLYSIELSVTGSREDEPAVLAALGRVQKKLESIDGVARVDHAGRIAGLRTVMRWPRAADTAAGRAMLDDWRSQFRVVAGGKVHWRLSALARPMASRKAAALADELRRVARESLPKDVSWHVTGLVPLINQAQLALVRTQIESFSLAGMAALVLIGVLFRSVRAAAVSLLPNVVPIAVILGVMALVGIPLDGGTVMIAAVAIGIAVDDTIHYLYRYRQERRRGHGVAAAALGAGRRVGRQMVFTSVVAAGGFAVLSLSPFRPLAWFGILTGLTMLTALVGDLVLLPASAKVGRLWQRRTP